MSFPTVQGTQRVVASVSAIPVPQGALVACDLDDTLIHSSYAFVGDKWHKPLVVRLMHPDDAVWCHDVATRAHLVYITARDPSIHPLTTKQLQDLGLPVRPVIYDEVKGRALLDVVQQAVRPYTAVLFVDDLDTNHRSVRTHMPEAVCYRVDAALAEKLAARMRRKLAAHPKTTSAFGA